MENDEITTRGTEVQPIDSDFSGARAPLVGGAADDGDRNPVFTSLVKGDGDIVGLVAYSIYKQNKLDWLLAFQRATGREPNEQENIAYIIGEATPRRLATYRHLADSTLAGSGPDLPSATGKPSQRSSYAYPGRQGASQGRPTTIIVYAILAIVVIAAIIAAVKFLPRT
jgi:hypothetical protein